MSAQVGIWNFDGQPVDQSFLEKFTAAIEQHGPDGGNAYIDGSIAMVYRAFHTTPESHLERQPYVTPCGTVITWDGRLDNREEFMPQLREELAADQTDVAIVAAAFERWGTDCFRRIVGDWAVSIWRPLERELLLACDYMAVRHIFYYPKKDRIWWSTDLAPLVLLSGDKFHVDDNYIAGYFANDPDSDLTPYRELRQVPAGQFVYARNGNVSVQRYWRFSPKSRIRYKTDAEYEEHFRHVFRQSVRRRLRSDSAVLAELSGGLDSSSIVCMADDILAKEGAQAPYLDTVSYYDKTEPNGDDWIYFPKIEERRGRGGAHIDASKLGRSPTSLDYPEFSVLPGYLGTGRKLEAERAAVLRDGKYRAVLSGIGGDEFLGGIPDPREQLADLIMQFRLVALARQLIAWSLIKKKPWIQLLVQALVVLLPPSLAQNFSNRAKVESWVEGEFARRTKLAIRLLGPNESFGLWLPTRRSCIGGVLLMANKLAKLKSPMLALEEGRYPYLDQSLIEFILSIPATQLLRPGQRRSLMRRSLVGIVPQEILSRRTKQLGARTRVVALEQTFDQLRSAFHLPLSSHFGYVNHIHFLERLQAARNGKEIHISRMTRTISLEFWLRDLAARGLLRSGAVSAPLGATELPHLNGEVRASHPTPATPASKVVGTF
jgi:asparagine synthase (glutamine-hydrolysing)